MIDYIASKTAYREYEERVRTIRPIDNEELWLTREAGQWQAPQIGSLLVSLRKGLATFAARLRTDQNTRQDSKVSEQKQSSRWPVPDVR